MLRRADRVELLGDRDKRHIMFVEQLDELCEVRQGPGQTVDLVDNDDVDLACGTSSSSLCKAGRSVSPPEKPPSSYLPRRRVQPA